jgi:hypothetical protein
MSDEQPDDSEPSPERQVVHIAVDVTPAHFGDVLGELNRARWTITASEELDEERHTFPADAPARDVGWFRIHAERKLDGQPFRLGY